MRFGYARAFAYEWVAPVAGVLSSPAHSDSAIALAWTAAANGTGPVAGQLEQSADGSIWSDVAGATASPLTLEGLTSDTLFYFRVRYTDAAGLVARSDVLTVNTDPPAVTRDAAILADAPSLFWKLDDATPSGPAADSSGNGADGVYFANAYDAGGAAATSTGGTVAWGPAAIPAPTTALTAEIYATFPAPIAGYNAVLTSASAAGGSWALVILNNCLRFWPCGANGEAVSSPIPDLGDGVEHQLAVTHDAGLNATRFFVDGAEVGTLAPASSGSFPTDAGACVGSGANSFFACPADVPFRRAVVYLDQVLSPARLAAHFNAPL